MADNDNEFMTIEEEDAPLFTLAKQMTAEETGGEPRNVWNFEHKVPYALILAEKGAMAILGSTFLFCNKKGYENVKEVKLGDLIVVTSDINDPYYVFWGPQGTYEIPEGYHAIMKVEKIAQGGYNEPIIFATTRGL